MKENGFCDEKRKFIRVNVPNIRVSFKLLDPRTWSSYHEKNITPVENISLGGVALKTANELTVKAPIGLDLRYDPEKESIRTFGRVAWIKKESGDKEYSLGISFSWWKREEDKKVIFDLIKKHQS
ncbi:MAG: PilZ domain-containing protein [Candidatus Omnitrophica bacterium]|nr:PilZ domain-containing protein [Candidatus Omnitrophota bacterium]